MAEALVRTFRAIHPFIHRATEAERPERCARATSRAVALGRWGQVEFTGGLERERRRVAAAQAGSEEAWRELFDEYYPRLQAFMRSRVSPQQAAEDLAAETFVDAFRGLPRFRWRGTPFGAWLFKVARNRLRMHYRSVQHEPDYVRDVDLPEAVDYALAVDIAATLASLPPEYREAIELRYILGLTGPEAAAAMGRSHGAFRMLLHRATGAFRDEFGKDAGTVPESRDSWVQRRISTSEQDASPGGEEGWR